MPWNTRSLPLNRIFSQCIIGVCCLIVVFMPSAVLMAIMTNVEPNQRMSFLIGTSLEVGFLGVMIYHHGLRGAFFSRAILMLYCLALIGILSFPFPLAMWIRSFVIGSLLLVSLTVLIVQEVKSASRRELRKTHLLIRKLAYRTDWPAKLEDCRRLPEVVQLQNQLQSDAGPALVLLAHPRPEVRLAVLTALQYRKNWPRKQAEIVLHTAQVAVESVVRVSALTALAEVNEVRITHGIMTYMRDHSIEVRKAAIGTLLWDAKSRWQNIRFAIRNILSDSKYANDGPLPCLKRLPPNAVSDLTIWASEVGVIGRRATQTLIAYYRQLLQEEFSASLIDEYQLLIFDPSTPAAIRVELACSLRDSGYLTDQRFIRLMEPHQPAPLRIIGAEVALSIQLNPQAIDVLREVASQPNRQLALAVARVVQKYLGVDMGLPLHEMLPPPQSKQAAEVTRRIMAWAMQKAVPETLISEDPSTETNAPLEAANPKKKSKPVEANGKAKKPSSPLIDSETLFIA